MNTDKIEAIKELHRQAKAFDSFFKDYEEKVSDKDIDKYECHIYNVDLFHASHIVFGANIALMAYTGTYGNSSVYTFNGELGRNPSLSSRVFPKSHQQ